MSGTVNISRSIWSDAAFKEQPFTEREAFMWLVMEASWKAREKRVGSAVVSLERGQLASSIRFMSEAWGWQKSTVDRFLKRLEKRDMIGTASGTGITVITVCKYNEYQSAPKASGTPQKRKAGQQRDSSGTNEKKGLIPEEINNEDTDVSLPAPRKPKPRKFQMPEDAQITDGMQRAATKRGHSLQEAQAQFDRFKNDALAKAKAFADWDRAFVTWLDSPYFKPITTGGQNNGKQNSSAGARPSPHSALFAGFGASARDDDASGSEPSDGMRDITPASEAGMADGPDRDASEPFLRLATFRD